MRSHLPRAAAAAAALAAFAASLVGPAPISSPAFAEDVVVLTTGRELRGEVVEETEDRVRIKISGGSIWYPKDRIKEIRRAAEEDDAIAADSARTDHFLLYSDGRRVGTRILRYTPRKDGHQWESHVVFLGEDGMPALDMRTIERSTRDFRPILFQIMEKPTDGIERLIRGEVIGARFEISVTESGETDKTVINTKEGARFPLAAQEEFLRTLPAIETVKADGEGSETATAAIPVYLPYVRRWRDVTFRDAGTRVVEHGQHGIRVRVVERRCGALRELVWIDGRGGTRMADINGSGLRALGASAQIVAAVSAGEPDRVTGHDSAARTVFHDPAMGFSIRKPDPSWLFEEPTAQGGGALLVVRNRPLGASVDVLRDDTPGEDITLARAGDSLERLLRAHSREFELVRRDYGKGADGEYLEVEATSTTKGERIGTLARIHFGHQGEVYRLLAACPIDRFAVAKKELSEILDSFRLDPLPEPVRADRTR